MISATESTKQVEYILNNTWLTCTWQFMMKISLSRFFYLEYLTPSSKFASTSRESQTFLSFKKKLSVRREITQSEEIQTNWTTIFEIDWTGSYNCFTICEYLQKYSIQKALVVHYTNWYPMWVSSLIRSLHNEIIVSVCVFCNVWSLTCCQLYYRIK